MDYVNGIIIIKYKYVIKIKYKNNNVYIYMMDTVISEENVKANQQINKKMQNRQKLITKKILKIY